MKLLKVILFIFLFLYGVYSLEKVTIDVNAQTTPEEKKIKNDFFDFVVQRPKIMEVKPNTIELRETHGLSIFSTRVIEEGEIILDTNLTKTENFISKRLFLNYAKEIPEDVIIKPDMFEE